MNTEQACMYMYIVHCTCMIHASCMMYSTCTVHVSLCEGTPASPTPARLHSLSEAGVGLASPSGDQAAQRYSEQS